MMTDSIEPVTNPEPVPNSSPVNDSEPVLHADSTIRGYLIEVTKWGKFLAILGYIGLGFMICVSLIILFFGNMIPAEESLFPTNLFGLIYLVFSILYFIPVHQLYLFSASIREAVDMNLQDRFTEGFSHLKTLFRFMGILSIVVLGLYAIILLIAVPMAMMVAR